MQCSPHGHDHFLTDPYASLHPKNKEALRNAINASLNGLKIMRQTYTGNAVHENRLDEVIKSLTKYANKQI